MDKCTPSFAGVQDFGRRCRHKKTPGKRGIRETGCLFYKPMPSETWKPWLRQEFWLSISEILFNPMK